MKLKVTQEHIDQAKKSCDKQPWNLRDYCVLSEALSDATGVRSEVDLYTWSNTPGGHKEWHPLTEEMVQYRKLFDNVKTRHRVEPTEFEIDYTPSSR